MIEWNETHLRIRDMIRRFVETEIKPNLEALEHGDCRPTTILRKMVATFGIAEMAKARFAARQRPRRRAATTRSAKPSRREERGRRSGDADDPDHRAVPLQPRHGHRARRVAWA